MAITAEQSAKMKAYYQANKDAIKARVRVYASARKAEISARNKLYRRSRKDEMRDRSRKYYEAHREEKIAYQKEHNAMKSDAVRAYKQEWWAKQKDERNAERRADREHQNQTFRKWYVRNREKFCAHVSARRARKKSTQIEPVDYKKVLMDSRGICGICHESLDLFGTDIDHIVPLAKGGAHVQENLQATHSRCNRSKGAKVA